MDTQVVEQNPQPMRLNFDVLFLVMSAMTRRSDVLACMLTCRTLYEVGVQRLLSLPLHIPINNTIIPLCEYILTQFPHRSRHLRELKLGHPGNEQLSSITSSTVDLLARVLSGAQDLRTVTIYNINQAFISDSTLSDALSHLKGINELNVMSPSYPLFKALEKMDASLKKLRVDFYSYNRQPIDPLPKIAPFNITLENLSISFVKFSRTPKLEETVVFPRVHVLSIKQSPLTPLETLIHSFPDVRRLTLFMSHHSNVLLEIPAQACRESNQAAQHRKPWSSLNYVQADALSLYLLGLDSMVHHVDIRDITTPVMHLVPMVLLDIRPTRLALSIPTRNCDIEALPVLLGQALRHLQLTHFFVTLDLSYSYPCLEEVYSALMGSISYLSAPNFKLTIHWTPPTQIGISNIKPAVLKDAVGTEIALKLYNAAKLAKRIAYCSAVIKNICFEVWLHPVTFWRVLPPSEEGDLDSDKEIGLQVERVRDGSGWKIFSD